MIHDVDDALRSLLKRDVRAAADVEISFEAPSTDWASRRSGPAINLYLYDIREDLARRAVLWERKLDPEDPRITTGKLPPPRFFKLSYLITAWTQRPEDEHRLLSACLGCFLRYDLLPRELTKGSLEEVGTRCIVQVAQPPPGDRSISDIWTALGGELKPSLDLRITAPFAVERVDEVGPPVREHGELRVRTSKGELERPPRVRRGRSGGEGFVDEEGTWHALVDEALHGEGAKRVPAAHGDSAHGDDEDAGVEASPAAEVVGAEEGRWFRVRERPRTQP